MFIGEIFMLCFQEGGGGGGYSFFKVSFDVVECIF